MIRFLKDWLVPLLVAVILTYAINSLIMFKIRVPTESMAPQILPRDQIFVTRIHSWTKLERGDIIVFDSEELNEVLIKRLIGLPGDKVEFKKGYIEINGAPFDDSFVKNRDSYNGKFEVPTDCYLFIGDNRPNSFDARLWKNHYIPRSKLLGKAGFRIYPFNRIGFVK